MVWRRSISRAAICSAIGTRSCMTCSFSTVILRCSPHFAASLEGWATSARGDPSRRHARARLLRMTAYQIARCAILRQLRFSPRGLKRRFEAFMPQPIAGGVDCDLHPAVPHLTSLLPYLSDYWRDQVTTRGMTDLMSQSYPQNSPITSRPDWRPSQGKPGSSLADMQAQALDKFGTAYGICNPLYGVQMVFSEDMADAFCRALNDWLVKEWLDKDSRLRGSIVIPVQSVEKSVAEIERCARDRRFVQVLMLVMGDMPLGKRAYWPIYAAAERLGLPIGIHAGSNYHNPPTSVGWGSYHIEDYVAQAQAFQTQLTSLIVEGVFARHPNMKIVMLESGFTWLPSYLWRLHKFWRGVRIETPWVDRAPMEIVRSNIRFSLQPVDAPPDPTTLNRLFDHMQSDELLLFSTDYPHWQFDGDAVLPEGMSPELVRKIMIDNPHATYTRLKQSALQETTP